MTIQTYPAPKSQVTSSFWRYTATGGETTLTGIDNAGVQLAYLPGQEQVFLNGVLLVRGTDYTATNGTSIVGLSSLTAGDYIQVTTYSNFTVTNIPVGSISGSITNLQLANSTFTLGSTLINLGDTKNTIAGLTLTSPTINNPTIGTTFSTSVPIIVKGAVSQAVNLQEWQDSSANVKAYISSAGNISTTGSISGGSITGSSLGSSGSISMPNNSNTSTNKLYMAGGDTNHYIYSTGSGGNAMVFGEYGNFSWYNTSTNASYMNLDSAGNLQLGSGYSTANSLRFFDIYNQDTNGGSGSIIRLITQQSSSTSLTSVDMVKYKNGNFIINNNDSAAAILFGTAGTNRLTINNVGNVGLGLASQTNPYPSGESTMEINVTQGGQNALWLKNYGGSAASPTETTDWPKAVLAATSYGNFFLQTMLSFNLPGDGIYKTDNSIWNFRLNGVTGGGWDNNLGVNTTTPINTSTGATSGPVGLQLLGPGNLRLGTDGAYNIFFHTNATQQAAINSSGYLLVGYTTSNGAYKLQVNSQIFATSASIQTSDGRFKENVNTINNGLQLVDALNPVSFNWKKHNKHNFVEGKTVGFIAQEVQEALKDYEWVNNVIKENKDQETGEEFLGLVDSAIIPLLVSAVKELSAKVKELEAK